MFQFPFNPVVGQLYAPTAGVTYRWNGFAWYLVHGFITLSEADARFIPLTQKAAANGVATLDATTKVPVAQLPVGTAGGIAGLDGSGKIDIAQTPGARGDCRVRMVSSTDVRLFPWQGNTLTINGTNRTIPDVGVLMSNTTLPANDTTYYLYAFWTGSAIALEVSTTGYVAAFTNGMNVKSGDPTRTLVGMVRKTGGVFSDQPLIRYTRSWFNDPGISGVSISLANTVIGFAPFAEIDAAGTRCHMLLWQLETVMGTTRFNGFGQGAPGSGAIYATWGVDGAAAGGAVQGVTMTRANEWAAAECHFDLAGFTEGYHFVSVFGGVTSLAMAIQAGYTGLTYRTRRV